MDFILENYFDGPLSCHGVVLTRSGKLRRSFRATMHGIWNTGTAPVAGSLSETFTFDNGEVLERLWQFTKTGPNAYEGAAADIKGVARLHTSGPELFMRYTLVVQVGQRTLPLSVKDVLWLTPDGYVMNKSTMYKFGIKIGELLTVIHKS
ncbi:DUF3833 domain-containing protein [Desulfobaculum bizertense]|uniref:DUF3833 family protein n=1 Tax=Desulfobaculum bizertense TaxID=376490 RepID=UPI001F1BFD42|nr:DUF3833 family protein [Desulfobaculum bizertense]UIJ38743.1 DUF3833 domain-containing protein [Desulfobaculum bizertense]